MLVLTRRQKESIVFPGLGIKIQLVQTSASKARIGIEAPPEIQVMRSELLPQRNLASAMQISDRPANPMGRCLSEAADILRRLHETIESSDWQQSESLVFALFHQLRSVDEQVATLACGAPPPARSARQALLVDDNENENRLLASYLRLKDFEVATAKDGADAVKFLDENEAPDVVVLDMNMPVYDGPWTVDQVRSNPKHQGLRIYAVSGSNPSDHGVEVGSGGVDRWFCKPLNPEKLVNEITRGVDAEFNTVA